MLLLCLALTACAPKGGADDRIYRDAAAPIYSNAAFDLVRLSGVWDQVAAFSGPTCQRGEAEFANNIGATSINYRLCLSGRDVVGAGAIVATGPGRFKVEGKDGLGQDWWVLWVDESYRTMAVGNPAGTFGFILNRGTVLPEDRLNAAREVFDFNGYDIRMLSVFGA